MEVVVLQGVLPWLALLLKAIEQSISYSRFGKD